MTGSGSAVLLVVPTGSNLFTTGSNGFRLVTSGSNLVPTGFNLVPTGELMFTTFRKRVVGLKHMKRKYDMKYKRSAAAATSMACLFVTQESPAPLIGFVLASRVM